MKKVSLPRESCIQALPQRAAHGQSFRTFSAGQTLSQVASPSARRAWTCWPYIDIFSSCWCCPFQRIGELRKLRKHHPELWARLLELDNRARMQFGPGPLGQFKQNWSVEGLERRFAAEDAQIIIPSSGR